MSIAATLQSHLSRQGADYEVVNHPQTFSSSQTAQVSHVSGKFIAKGVVLKDGKGYLLAILPASHHIRFNRLHDLTHRDLTLASEEETANLFSDCDTGAIPALGEAYGVEMVVDDSLLGQSDIYCEGGDHHSLLRMSGKQFERLLGDVPHGRFSDNA